MISPFRLSALAGLMAVCVLVSSLSAGSRSKRPITNPKFDPAAEQVELFKGIEDGQLDVFAIPKDANGGNVFVENKSDKTITVKLPESIVGVQVLKQFDGGFGQGAGGAGGIGGNSQGGGQNQQFGGGFGGGGLGGAGLGGFGQGNVGGGGAGFFSIPPEQVVRVPYTSVCLEHGKPEPKPKMRYRLVQTEEFTDDPVLRELLKLVASGRISKQAAQAAAWHLTDDMSWQELAAKEVKRLGGLGPQPYFQRADLYVAMQLVEVAKRRADGEQPAGRVESPRVQSSRVRVRGR